MTRKNMKGRFDAIPEDSMGKAKKDDSLNETNFRDFAQKIIAKYTDKGLMADALIWNQVIAHYEEALEAATQHDRPNGEE